MTDIKFDWAT